MVLTNQDTRDAYYAWRLEQYQTPVKELIVNEEAEAFFGSYESYGRRWEDGGEMREDTTFYDPHEKEDQRLFYQECVAPQMARYKRGKALMASYKLVTTESFMCNFDYHLDELEKKYRLVAPAFLQSSGWENTQEFFVWVALAEKVVKQEVA